MQQYIYQTSRKIAAKFLNLDSIKQRARQNILYPYKSRW